MGELSTRLFLWKAHLGHAFHPLVWSAKSQRTRFQGPPHSSVQAPFLCALLPKPGSARPMHSPASPSATPKTNCNRPHCPSFRAQLGHRTTAFRRSAPPTPRLSSEARAAICGKVPTMSHPTPSAPTSPSSCPSACDRIQRFRRHPWARAKRFDRNPRPRDAAGPAAP